MFVTGKKNIIKLYSIGDFPNDFDYLNKVDILNMIDHL